MQKYLDDYISRVKKPGSENMTSKQTWLWHDEDELLGYEDVFENYHDR